ncbi:hypothetical protein OFY17_10280 [Marinomonas sp. C2222]|uniref:Uncharacterized protein n=1 Tax=Marinomonas sargassi TaxID=2984494 RepID=A0ABT2YTR0_9GAMM|nr:hypothetical protein [Marinomonas sargassi]MCV2403266.1 hypothetical protein [Marinomonas sargassi]
MSAFPEYQEYSNDELAEALEYVDRSAYPDRLEAIENEIASRSIPDSHIESTEAPQESGEYVPNHVPLYERIKNVLMSLSFLIFGTIGVVENDLAVKLCKRCDKVYHLQDEAAWIMYIAMLLMAAAFISEVVDHYDKKDNEHLYHRISNLESYIVSRLRFVRDSNVPAFSVLILSLFMKVSYLPKSIVSVVTGS